MAGLVAASKSTLGVKSYASDELAEELRLGRHPFYFSAETTLDINEVAVSKLCCPAGWEYFDILSNGRTGTGTSESGTYKICGRHSTVYPVQLPAWTQPDVEELIERFDKYLRIELVTMCDSDRIKKEERRRISGSTSGHKHHPSLQSVSSTITSVSDYSNASSVDDVDPIPWPTVASTS